MLNVKYKDKIHTIAMNGQTGKMVGNIPVDIKKAVRNTIFLTAFFYLISFCF